MHSVIAAVVLLTGLVGGCRHDGPGPATTPGRSTAPFHEVVTCESAMQGKDYCAAIDQNARGLRYAYVPSLADMRSVTLVDVGGPGASLFGPTWPNQLIAVLQKADPHTGLIFLEEPWVTQKPTVECTGASSAWYVALRASRSMRAPSKEMVERCELDSSTASPWGWTPVDYATAVRTVERQVGRRITRFVGASFAGARLSYLTRRWSRVVLVSPLPTGVRLDRYANLRQRLLADALGRCPRCADSPTTKIAGRSIPVTSFDRTSAAVAAGYLHPRRAERVLERIRTGVTEADLELVGRFSDSALGRIGTADLSPAVLAIWSEQCRVIRPSWPFRHEGYFSRYLSPCAFIPQAAMQRPTLVAKRVCLSLAEVDRVVPVELSLAAFASPKTTVRTYSGAHGSLRGLAECLRPSTTRRNGK